MPHYPGQNWSQYKWKPMIWSYLCLQLVIFICVVTLMIVNNRGIAKPIDEHAVNPDVPRLGDLASVSQIYQDWHAKPFVSIEVVEGGNTCPAGSDPVFFKEWKGLELGCFFDSWFSDDEVKPMSEFGKNTKRCPRRNRPPEYPPVMQTNVNGKTICGARGGDTFAEVTRPGSNAQCPTGTVPCSDATSPENTVCYPQAETAAKCPITEIKIVNQSE